MINTDIYYSNFEDHYPEYTHLNENHKTLMYYCVLADINDKWAIAHIHEDNDIKVICYLINVYKNELYRLDDRVNQEETATERYICETAIPELKRLLVQELSHIQYKYLI